MPTPKKPGELREMIIDALTGWDCDPPRSDAVGAMADNIMSAFAEYDLTYFKAAEAGEPTLQFVISEIERTCPGWWWTCGNCEREAHATIGPEVGTEGPPDGFEGLAEAGDVVGALQSAYAKVRYLKRRREAPARGGAAMKDNERLVEAVARAIAKARYRREAGEELEDKFLEGMAARCVNEALDALVAINASGIAWVAPVEMTEEMKAIGADHIRGCRDVGAATDQQTAQIVWGMERLTYLREQGVVPQLPGPDVHWESSDEA